MFEDMSITMDREKINEISLYWGSIFPMMAMEEMAELTQAISKFERYDRYKGTRIEPSDVKELKLKNNLREEIRDVFISLFGLMVRYGIDEKDVQREIYLKTNKKYD